MRGIRIAAFSVAAILACVVISHMFSGEPAADEDSQAGVEPAQDRAAPPVVPPPPPLPGEPGAQPLKKPPVREKAAEAQPAPGSSPQSPGSSQQALEPPEHTPASPQPVQSIITAEAAALDVSPADAKATLFQGNELAADSADGAQAPAPAVAVAEDEPKGPVIVVPLERRKEESRGARWLKAMGHALGIGGRENPIDLAFQQ